MGVKVIMPAAGLVVPLDELKVHLRTDEEDTSEDGLLTGLLASAVAYAEHYTQRSIGEQVLELALDAFPCGPIELPRGPVESITSIKYLDIAGAEQTLSASLYALDDYGLSQWALMAAGTEWPSTYAAANAVKVRYATGSLPEAVKTALLLMVGHHYANREAVNVGNIVNTMPFGVDELLNTVKVWSF